MARIEHAAGRGDRLDVVIRGLAQATTLTVDELLALSRIGRLLDTVFHTATGQIRAHLQRPKTLAECRAKLAERHPDGSPRRRCSACGDAFDDEWRCYCTRRRRPDGWSGAKF